MLPMNLCRSNPARLYRTVPNPSPAASGIPCRAGVPKCFMVLLDACFGTVRLFAGFIVCLRSFWQSEVITPTIPTHSGTNKRKNEKNWVAVKELELSYHNLETTLFTTCPYCGKRTSRRPLPTAQGAYKTELTSGCKHVRAAGVIPRDELA